MTKVTPNPVNFNHSFDTATLLDSIEWLKKTLNITPKPHDFEEIIINKLKEHFSFEIADYLFKKNVIKDLPNKLYQGFDDFPPSNLYKLNLLVWIFSNEDVTAKYVFNLRHEGIYSQISEADFSTEILRALSSSLNLNAPSKDTKLYPYIFKQLSKNKVFAELIKCSSNNIKCANEHAQIIKDLFFLTINALKNSHSDNPKDKDNILNFFKILFAPNQNNNFVIKQVLEYTKNNISHKHYNKYIYTLYPYLEFREIKKICNVLIKDYCQKEKTCNPFTNSITTVNKFGLNKDIWKEYKYATLPVTQKTNLDKTGCLALMLFSFAKETEKKLKDYVEMTNPQKELYFKEVLNSKYPILLNILSKGERTNKITKELINMGIKWIEKHGNYPITYFSKSDEEIKTSLMDILVRGAFINNHTNNFKFILKNEKILDFIIENDVLDDFREYSIKYKFDKKIKAKVSLTEDAIKSHILDSVITPSKEVPRKKLKL